jgi:hypothetical protein
LSVVVPAELVFAEFPFFDVVPFEFDPFDTRLVAALWKSGIGCPTNATIVPFAPPNFDTLGPPEPFTDPACPTGDDSDTHNEGLLLAKTGPTNNNASSGADLVGVQGITLFELGYDIRKPGVNISDPRGSHCGAGAPRFNVTRDDGALFFVGCASPPPNVDNPGLGFQRLRWGGGFPLLAFPQKPTDCPMMIQPCSITGITVQSISIVFDEGQDPSGGPDEFGLAVLDNIDVNNTLVGRAPAPAP